MTEPLNVPRFASILFVAGRRAQVRPRGWAEHARAATIVKRRKAWCILRFGHLDVAIDSSSVVVGPATNVSHAWRRRPSASFLALQRGAARTWSCTASSGNRLDGSERPNPDVAARGALCCRESTGRTDAAMNSDSDSPSRKTSHRPPARRLRSHFPDRRPGAASGPTATLSKSNQTKITALVLGHVPSAAQQNHRSWLA